MKFLIDVDPVPSDGGEPFTAEQIREHLQTYVFSPDVLFEMSLEPGNPYHELPCATYRDFQFAEGATVEVVPDA